ncbi:MAG: hypothetical protein GF398_08625 [Chitinivibrionales bacterium]|nr:hypothetical protein [Chitinivibrionales bacterium]
MDTLLSDAGNGLAQGRRGFLDIPYVEVGKNFQLGSERADEASNILVARAGSRRHIRVFPREFFRETTAGERADADWRGLVTDGRQAA